MEQNKNQQSTALLVMDVHEVTVNRLKDSTPFINSITKAIQTARNSIMPVIYVIVGFRKGYPEVSPNNKSFSVLKNGTQKFDNEEAVNIHASIAPEQGDVIIIKNKKSIHPRLNSDGRNINTQYQFEDSNDIETR